MTSTKNLTLAALILVTIFTSSTVKAQEDDQLYIKITKMHRNLNSENPSFEKWVEMEKIYLEKVIMKNEFILQREVFDHYMTQDNTEALFIHTYKNWDDIEKADNRNRVLVKEGWPDIKTRTLFFDELGEYFDKNQSDEIFMTVPGKKENPSNDGKSLFYHMRVNQLAFPKDGTEAEFLNLNDEFLKSSVYNNRYIIGYYPMMQVLGSDKRQYIEITAVESLDDLENAFKVIDVFLYEPEKESLKKHSIFIESYFKYFDGFHSDYIYKSVPQLKK